MLIKAVVISVTAMLSQCGSDPIPAERPTQIITVGEDYTYQFDARNGDRIDLVMNPIGDILARCDHSGGELIWSPYTTLYICEGVDF